MDPSLLKFLSDVAGLAATQLDEAARRTAPPEPNSATEATPSTPSGSSGETPAASCVFCGTTGVRLFAGACGPACFRCIAGGASSLLTQLVDAANVFDAEEAQHRAVLAELDRRTQAIQEGVQSLAREAAALRDERDRLIAFQEAELETRTRAGVRRIVVAGENQSAELWIDVARVDRALVFFALEFPGAALFVDDELQDVAALARRVREQSERDAIEILRSEVAARSSSLPVLAVASPAPPSDPGLAALVAHVDMELNEKRSHTAAERPIKPRHATATGRQRIDAWLAALHARGLELASGLRTPEDIARHLNPATEVSRKARLGPGTIGLFRTHPRGRTMDTLVRIAVAMGRADLFELRPSVDGTGWSNPTPHTIN